MNWQSTTIDETLLQLAFAEDLGTPWHDVTTELLFPQSIQGSNADIISKHPEPLVVCGMDWLHTLFGKLSAHYQIRSDYRDGDWLLPGKILATIVADSHTLLKAERITLNFLRHLCAIATLTAHYVKKVQHTRMKILDTRKTTPGMRHLEKYAVFCGGGVNHRMGLYDALMVKDTHIDLLGGMKATLQKLPHLQADSLAVIVEVRNPQELALVIEFGSDKVNRVLLDNMDIATLKQCVAACQGKFATEASGNIRLANVAQIAETGVDFASVGELTYGAGHVDLSMQTFIAKAHP